jgi:hypothetical protein
MPYHFDGAVNGNPVGVYVQKAHEDTYHDALVVKILSLFNFFYNNHATISRGNNNTVCVTLETTNGTLEEIGKNQVYTNANACKYVEGELIGDTEV